MILVRLTTSDLNRHSQAKKSRDHREISLRKASASLRLIYLILEEDLIRCRCQMSRSQTPNAQRNLFTKTQMRSKKDHLQACPFCDLFLHKEKLWKIKPGKKQKREKRERARSALETLL